MKANEMKKEENPVKNHSDEDLKSLLMTFIILWIITPTVVAMHTKISAPVAPGHTLKVGQFRNNCGIFSYFPKSYTGCTGPILEFKENGLLELFEIVEEENKVLWSIQGTCPEDDECELTIAEDGAILIGGVVPKAVKKKGKKEEIELSPWPFVETPPKRKKSRK